MRYVMAGLALLLLTGCGRVQNERLVGGAAGVEAVTMAMTMAGGAAVGAPGALTVRLSDAGAAVRGATVQVEATMTHAGMEPLFLEADETGAGQYETIIPWTMGGEWAIAARATLPDGRVVARALGTVEVASP